MDLELKAIVMKKESFAEFVTKYFHVFPDNWNCYRNASGEILNLNTAEEFYGDYLNSGMSLKEYIKETTKEA